MRILIGLCLLVFLSGCLFTKKSLPSIVFDWQGHRGCRGLRPENTIPAMLHAVDLGVTTLEMDAMITKDKQVILSHDPFLSHEITTKPDGTFIDENEEKQFVIYKMNYEEESRFDVGTKSNPKFPQQEKMKAVKPKLADVIDSVEAYTLAKKLPAKFYNIETKSTASTDEVYHPKPAEFVELLMQVILEKEIETRTIIQSFDVRTLQYLHTKYPAIKTALLIEDLGGLKKHISKLGFTPTIYSPDFRLVNKLLIKHCKEAGILLIPWTVNELSKMKKLKAKGVDGIITDYPNLIF